jgi:hypothetical protein
MVDPKMWTLPSPEDIRDVLRSQGARMYGIGEGVGPKLEGPFEAWFKAIQTDLRPLSRTDPLSAPRLDEVAAMGRAQAEFLRQAAAVEGLDESARKAILADMTLIFPGITVLPADKGG